MNRLLLWFAAENGMSRYDGSPDPLVFSHDPSRPTSIGEEDVSTLHVAADGALWIGTWGAGLDRYRSASQDFEHFPHRAGDSDGCRA